MATLRRSASTIYALESIRLVMENNEGRTYLAFQLTLIMLRHERDFDPEYNESDTHAAITVRSCAMALANRKSNRFCIEHPAVKPRGKKVPR